MNNEPLQMCIRDSILAADKFAGQVVVITLCAAVKAGFLYQPVEYIVTEGGMAAVFTGQADDPSGSIVFHTARQPALRGTDGLSPRIVLCPVSAAVRSNDGGQVTGGVVFIPHFMALHVFQMCIRDSYLAVSVDLGDALSTGAWLGYAVTCCVAGESD